MFESRTGPINQREDKDAGFFEISAFKTINEKLPQQCCSLKSLLQLIPKKTFL